MNRAPSFSVYLLLLFFQGVGEEEEEGSSALLFPSAQRLKRNLILTWVKDHAKQVPDRPSGLLAAKVMSSSLRCRTLGCCWISTAVHTELSPWTKKEKEKDRWLLQIKNTFHCCWGFFVGSLVRLNYSLWLHSWTSGVLQNQDCKYLDSWRISSLSNGFTNHFPSRTNLFDNRLLM